MTKRKRKSRSGQCRYLKYILHYGIETLTANHSNTFERD